MQHLGDRIAASPVWFLGTGLAAVDQSLLRDVHDLLFLLLVAVRRLAPQELNVLEVLLVGHIVALYVPVWVAGIGGVLVELPLLEVLELLLVLVAGKMMPQEQEDHHETNEYGYLETYCCGILVELFLEVQEQQENTHFLLAALILCCRSSGFESNGHCHSTLSGPQEHRSGPHELLLRFHPKHQEEP